MLFRSAPVSWFPQHSLWWETRSRHWPLVLGSGFPQHSLSHTTRNRQRFLALGSWSPQVRLSHKTRIRMVPGSGFLVSSPPPPRTQQPGTAKPRTANGSWFLVLVCPPNSLWRETRNRRRCLVLGSWFLVPIGAVSGAKPGTSDSAWFLVLGFPHSRLRCKTRNR